MDFLYVKGTELSKYINEDMKVNYEDFKGGIYEGFTFFSPFDLKSYKDNNYFLAVEDGNIVGILKYKRYAFKDNSYVPEEELLKAKPRKNYLGVSYIDIHNDYKRQGIATKMLKAMNCWIREGEIIKVSFETGEGKDANILKTFKRELTKAKVSVIR